MKNVATTVTAPAENERAVQVRSIQTANRSQEKPPKNNPFVDNDDFFGLEFDKIRSKNELEQQQQQQQHLSTLYSSSSTSNVPDNNNNNCLIMYNSSVPTLGDQLVLGAVDQVGQSHPQHHNVVAVNNNPMLSSPSSLFIPGSSPTSHFSPGNIPFSSATNAHIAPHSAYLAHTAAQHIPLSYTSEVLSNPPQPPLTNLPNSSINNMSPAGVAYHRTHVKSNSCSSIGLQYGQAGYYYSKRPPQLPSPHSQLPPTIPIQSTSYRQSATPPTVATSHLDAGILNYLNSKARNSSANSSSVNESIAQSSSFSSSSSSSRPVDESNSTYITHF